MNGSTTFGSLIFPGLVTNGRPRPIMTSLPVGKATMPDSSHSLVSRGEQIRPPGCGVVEYRHRSFLEKRSQPKAPGSRSSQGHRTLTHNGHQSLIQRGSSFGDRDVSRA